MAEGRTGGYGRVLGQATVVGNGDGMVAAAPLLSHPHLHFWGLGGGTVGGFGGCRGGDSSGDPDSDPCGGDFALPGLDCGYFRLMGFFFNLNLLFNLSPLLSPLVLLLPCPRLPQL